MKSVTFAFMIERNKKENNNFTIKNYTADYTVVFPTGVTELISEGSSQYVA